MSTSIYRQLTALWWKAGSKPMALRSRNSGETPSGAARRSHPLPVNEGQGLRVGAMEMALRSSMWKVEVRTPTYRRPALLERSLRSLIGQTYPHWHCIVLDDEPGGGQAHEVCARLNESRIIYQPNERNLGVGP